MHMGSIMNVKMRKVEPSMLAVQLPQPADIMETRILHTIIGVNGFLYGPLFFLQNLLNVQGPQSELSFESRFAFVLVWEQCKGEVQVTSLLGFPGSDRGGEGAGEVCPFCPLPRTQTLPLSLHIWSSSEPLLKCNIFLENACRKKVPLGYKGFILLNGMNAL